MVNNVLCTNDRLKNASVPHRSLTQDSIALTLASFCEFVLSLHRRPTNHRIITNSPLTASHWSTQLIIDALLRVLSVPKSTVSSVHAATFRIQIGCFDYFCSHLSSKPVGVLESCCWQAFTTTHNQQRQALEFNSLLWCIPQGYLE